MRARKFVPVDERVAEDVYLVARRAGLSVTELIDNVIARFLEVAPSANMDGLLAGLSLVDAYGLRLVPLPAESLKRVPGGAAERLARAAARAGYTLALLARARGADPLVAVRFAVRALFPSANVHDTGSTLVLTAGRSEVARFASSVLKFLGARLGLVVEQEGNAVAVRVERRVRGRG